MTIRIANGAGFLGDQLDAPRRLVESATVDYLTLEYLAELTMSILARQRDKDSKLGYAQDFLDVVRSLVPALKNQSQLHLVTNAGGVNPVACVREASETLSAAGLISLRIGCVTGDDLLPLLSEFQLRGWPFSNLETGQPLSSLRAEIVSANAYLGAWPIADALADGARIVITGRVADASLTLGPCIHRHHWQSDDWKSLAGGTVAGHLIECGAQVTGAYSNRWRDLDLANVGYPIAEVAGDGSSIITKPDQTGGVVDRISVSQQLLYEIGDPHHYLTPDVDVDFTTIQLQEMAQDRVRVYGASGCAPPKTLKVSMAYRSGFTSTAQLLVIGRDCVTKAVACAEIIRTRLSAVGLKLEQFHSEFLGANQSTRIGEAVTQSADPFEVVLRISVRDPHRESVERFARELAPLITSGPAGLAGYAAGRPNVTPVFAYWPTLVPRDWITPEVQVKSVANWLEVTK